MKVMNILSPNHITLYETKIQIKQMRYNVSVSFAGIVTLFAVDRASPFPVFC